VILRVKVTTLVTLLKPLRIDVKWTVVFLVIQIVKLVGYATRVVLNRLKSF